MSSNPGGSVIVAGARTPIGRLLGGLKDQSAADLGGVAIRGALEKAGVSGDQVEYVIMGQVLQAGAGQITARQAAVKAGVPMTIPAVTINKVCLSGISAIALIPDRQTLLIVTAGMVIGTPALTAAWRAVLCRPPACSTCPMITYSTWSPETPCFSNAPLMAAPPRSAADWSLRPPSRRPMGVRAPATITDPPGFDDMGTPPAWTSSQCWHRRVGTDVTHERRIQGGAGRPKRCRTGHSRSPSRRWRTTMSP